MRRHCGKYAVILVSFLAHFFKSQTNGNKCYSEIPTLVPLLKWSPNLSSSYKVAHSLLSSIFAESMSESSFLQRASPARVRATLHLSFHPSRVGYILIHCNTSANHQATQMHLSFTVTSVFFVLKFERGWWLFGLRNELMLQLPERNGGWETMTHPVWFSLLLELHMSS